MNEEEKKRRRAILRSYHCGIPLEDQDGIHKQGYYSRHAVCPDCGGTKLWQTTEWGVVGPDKNRVFCKDCSWEGMVHDLAPGEGGKSSWRPGS